MLFILEGFLSWKSVLGLGNSVKPMPIYCRLHSATSLYQSPENVHMGGRPLVCWPQSNRQLNISILLHYIFYYDLALSGIVKMPEAISIRFIGMLKRKADKLCGSHVIINKSPQAVPLRLSFPQTSRNL